MNFLQFSRLFLVSVTLAGLMAFSLNAQNILKPGTPKDNLIRISPSMVPTIRVDNLNQLKTMPVKSSEQLPWQKTIVGTEFRQKDKKSDNALSGGSKITFDKSKLPGESVGFTYYDFQTNGAMPERLAYYDTGEEKIVQLFWMTDEVGDEGWTGRGTYFEMIDFSTPDEPIPIGIWSEEGRLEGSTRTGWPSMSMFPNGAIATPTHDPTPGAGQVMFTRNTGFGEGFQTTVLNKSRALWPRGVVDGKGYLHAIYTYDTANTKKEGQIAYVRSKDGGQTWSTEVLITGPDAFDGATTNGSGGDVYAMAARGDNVVIAYADTAQNFVFRKSTDAGDTWTRPAAILVANHQNYYKLADLTDGKIWFTSDTVFTPGRQLDIIIDSEGTTHFVCAIIPTYILGNGTVNNGELQRINEDTTWQSGIYTAVGLAYQYENSNQAGQLFANPVGVNGETLQGGTDAPYRLSRRWGSSYSEYPQLGLDAQDNIYCVYSGVKNGDFKSVYVDTSNPPDGTGDEYNDCLFGHIYATHKLKGDYTWSEPVNLTPDGADALFCTLNNDIINGRMLMAYSADGTPGDRVTNTELPQEETWVMAYAFDITKLNESPVASVDDNNNQNSFDVDIYPNPASNSASIKLESTQPVSNVTVELYDILGQKISDVYNGQVESSKLIALNLKNLPGGIYYCTVISNNQKITKKITVVK